PTALSFARVFGQSLVLVSILLFVLPAPAAIKTKAVRLDGFSDFIISESGITFCLLLIFSKFSCELDFQFIWIVAQALIFFRLVYFFVQLCGTAFHPDLLRIWTQLGIVLPLITLRTAPDWMGELSILMWLIGMQAIRMTALIPVTTAIR